MALFLTAPDLPRFIKVVVLYQAVPAAPLARPFDSVRLDRMLIVLRTLVVLSLLWTNIYYGYLRYSESYGGPPAPIQGRWEAELMQIDGKDAEKDSI
jgi:hypothetical protein